MTVPACSSMAKSSRVNPPGTAARSGPGLMMVSCPAASIRGWTSWASKSAATGGKLLTKPSKDALRQIRRRLSAEVKALRGANADAVVARLNPIKGWAAYYRIGVSKRAFGALDAHLWKLAWKWARFSHPNKPKRWVITRYFGMFNPARQGKWVFGSRETGFSCASSPGRRSSGTAWSPGGRPPTTRPHRVLGTAATPRQAPGGPGHLASAAPPARPVPALPGPATAHRPPAQDPGEWASAI